MTSNTNVKGKPVEITADCSDDRPPPINSTIATAPSKMHQNTRCETGASTLPPAVIVSITSEPESDEVMKNTITSTMPTKEVISVSGSSPSITNNFSSSAASRTPSKPEPMNWLMAVPPKAVIHRTETSDGTSSTATRNSRTVRPRLTRAMNMPTKGDQLIHQAQ